MSAAADTARAIALFELTGEHDAAGREAYAVAP